MMKHLFRHLTFTSQSRTNEKYLLCIPGGGLNDALCQIYKCLTYAEDQHRTLIIDSKKSGLFRDFGDFFEFIHIDTKYIEKTDESLYKKLNRYSCYPPECKGKLNKYKTKYNTTLRAQTFKKTGNVISFKIDQSYQQQLLVHDDSGGGIDSLQLLKRLRLKESIAQQARQQIAKLGRNYIAIHIRHTDYLSYYKEFFQEIYPSCANKNVLVCSDNASVIKEAKNFFDQSEILTTDTPQLGDDKCLHLPNNYSDANEKFNAPIYAIIDLIAMASAKSVFYPKIYKKNKKINATVSGYSRLAELLSHDKALINQLLHGSMHE